MAYLITFSGEAKVNGTPYKEGDTLSVSRSIHDRLKAEGKIVEPKPFKKELKKEESL